MSPFDIIDIPLDAREDTEQLGSKPKFWVLLDSGRWLFKEARPNTGEDWAEKAAAHIAREMGLNAATVELASYAGRHGCISLNFIDVTAGEALIHGNEILAWQVTGYEKAKTFRQSDHTIENIDAAIRGLAVQSDAESTLTGLAGYIVLDALIGNTDRHHENWGLKLCVAPHSRVLSLAPSFDHASSLGRELRDERRAELLASHRIDGYLRKGRGGIFKNPAQRHGENPLELVQVAARAYPRYFRPALQQVAALDMARIADIFDALPPERTSALARQFALAMVSSARASLIEIQT
ncbi:hypothetical protein BH11PSE8_BH11PSE8_05720 [soil metagenome]